MDGSANKIAGGGLRSSGVLAWLRLLRVESKVESILEARLREHDLNLAQFDVLAHIGARAGITQRELAESLLVTKGNVTQLLDRMEGRGWILRRREGRTNRLFLTGAGSRLFEEAVPEHEALVTELFDALSVEDQGQLHELLRSLDRALS
jgi:DNA-binding MarR family transcriptional regulator